MASSEYDFVGAYIALCFVCVNLLYTQHSLVHFSGQCRLWFTVVFNSYVVFPCLILQ